MIKKIAAKTVIGIIRIYQGAVSPYLMPACRYSPTCSQYGIEAVKKYGPLKGTWLGFRRMLSCHPWGGHGYDPVP